MSDNPQTAQPVPPPAQIPGGCPPLPTPGLVTAIGGMRIGSGCLNILAGLQVSILFVCTIFLLPLCCLSVLLIPLGIVEIISGAALLSGNPSKAVSLRGLAVLEIVCVVCCNIISMTVGIVTLAFMDNPQVRKYFADKGRAY